jgi:hypothetical protein
MGRLSDALNEGLRRSKKAERTGKAPRSVTYSGRTVDAAIAQGVANLYKMLDKYNVAIDKKTILMRAGDVALKELRRAANEIRDTGNLRKSVKWIRTRSASSVLLGYDYRRGGRHAHLIEYGWFKKRKKKGPKYIPGYALVKKTFQKTKKQVAKNIERELKATQKQIEKDIRI